MNPVPAEAEKNIKNAVVNKAVLIGSPRISHWPQDI